MKCTCDMHWHALDLLDRRSQDLGVDSLHALKLARLQYYYMYRRTVFASTVVHSELKTQVGSPTARTSRRLCWHVLWLSSQCQCWLLTSNKYQLDHTVHFLVFWLPRYRHRGKRDSEVSLGFASLDPSGKAKPGAEKECCWVAAPSKLKHGATEPSRAEGCGEADAAE